MHAPLFAYGTLRDPDLLARVLARPLNAEAMLAAVAPGFRAVHYPGRAYPALVRAPGAAAEGVVLTDLTPFERDLLDALGFTPGVDVIEKLNDGGRFQDREGVDQIVELGHQFRQIADLIRHAQALTKPLDQLHACRAMPVMTRPELFWR